MYLTPVQPVVYQTCVAGVGCVAIHSMKEVLTFRNKGIMILLGQAEPSLVTVIVKIVEIFLECATKCDMTLLLFQTSMLTYQISNLYDTEEEVSPILVFRNSETVDGILATTQHSTSAMDGIRLILEINRLNLAFTEGKIQKQIVPREFFRKIQICTRE